MLNFAFGKVGLAKGQTATAQIEDLRRGTEAPDEVDLERHLDKSPFISKITIDKYPLGVYNSVRRM